MFIKSTKKVILLALVASVFILPAMAFAQPAATISISTNIPGAQNVSTAGPCGWIVNFYDFSFIIAGLLAFGAIVYGGIKYSISGGNPSGQSEGRSWIYSALLGLLLLGGAWLILNTINPNLVTCTLPTLSPLSATAGGGGAGTGGTGGTTGNGGGGAPLAGNCAGGQCQQLPDCTASANVTCGGAPGMVSTLNCVQQNISQSPNPFNFSVSEGFPPTDQNAQHLVGGHSNGCATDIKVPNTGAGTCANVQTVLSAEAACGVSNIANNNEYFNCPGGHQYGQTTGQNIHVNSNPGGGC